MAQGTESRALGLTSYVRPVDKTRPHDINHTYLPPAISVQLILLNNLYPISDLERDLVRVFGGEVVLSIDIFGHRRSALRAREKLPSQVLGRTQENRQREQNEGGSAGTSWE